MKTIAIIPARGGSKGIPKKNLVQVSGKPLIYWTIQAAIKSKMIDRIIVSSDSDEILSYANTFNKVEIVHRPKSLAEDNTPTGPVVKHVLDHLHILSSEYEYIIVLQPTSPLRTARDIDQAYEALTNSEANALISVVKPEHHPLKCFKRNKEGYLEGLVNNDFPFMPRQKLPEVFQPNGAIYIIEVKEFLTRKNFFTEKTLEFSMPIESSVDVDTIEDIKKVESYVNR